MSVVPDKRGTVLTQSDSPSLSHPDNVDFYIAIQHEASLFTLPLSAVQRWPRITNVVIINILPGENVRFHGRSLAPVVTVTRSADAEGTAHRQLAQQLNCVAS